MSEAVDAVVIGAGVVGLAVARALALAGLEVVVLERAGAFGTETSSRNSEVIHAGLYYPAGSLKARTCVRGKDLLYEYCRARGVAHRRLGKLVVASATEELEPLARLRERARENGVDDLEWLDQAQARALEPELSCAAALLSPSTGIVDSHGFMRALLRDGQARGLQLALRSRFESAEPVAGGLRVRAAGVELHCRLLVNAAGLWAQEVAAAIAGLPPSSIPRRHLTKGSYFVLAGASPFSRLIYPMPASASLGIHLTLDLQGRARFGPDQEWVDAIGYAVDPTRASPFYPSIRRYFPGLVDGALEPGYAGVRPKVQAPGEPMADFVLQGPAEHGIAGLLNLYGMESPGLTAALALAEEVATRLGVAAPFTAG